MIGSSDGQLRKWVKGAGQPSAAHLNEPVDWINGYMSAMALGQPGGGDDPYARPFLGQINDQGPGGKPDLFGAMYWVRQSYMLFSSPQSNDTPNLNENTIEPASAQPKEPVPSNVFAALHLGEWINDSHNLPVDTPVWVVPVFDGNGDRRFIIVGSAGSSSRTALLRVTGTEDGGGQYQMAKLVQPLTIGSSDDSVNQSDLGAQGEIVRGLNTRERDRNTHDISLVEGLRPKEFIGYLLGLDDDGIECYAFDGLQWEDCTA